MSNAYPRAIAVLGGTFDPVHVGHLRTAIEVRDRWQLDAVHFVPCGQPYHRAAPASSAEHRAAMVELALQGEAGLVCDRRELRRDGPSYTVDTLAELREELGPQASITLTLGSDAAQGLQGWHRWQELLDFANLLLLQRPGEPSAAAALPPAWHQVIAERGQTPRSQACGAVFLEELRQLTVSSTAIRELLQAGRSPRYLTPDTVLTYIQHNHLYEPPMTPDSL